MPRAGQDDSIVPLSRWRAALARARVRAVREGPRGLIDELLSQPDVERFLPALPPQELYYAIREIGLADAHDLVALASPEQLRAFVDLDAWRRDEFLPERAAEWLDALVDAGPEKLAAAVDALDPELVALYLQRMVRVYDLTLEQPPDEPEGHFYPTPDRFFLLDVLPGGEQGKRIERFLDWVYRADIEVGRTIVMGAKWEMTSELEEGAYRWRSGRMADLGFVDFYDALEVYRWLDPQSVRIGEGSAESPGDQATTLPVAMAGVLGDGGFLGRVLSVLGDAEEVARAHTAILLLTNRVMAADLVEPGDPDAAREAIVRIASYLGIGLEYLGRGDPMLGAEALRTVAVVRIFRVGVSLTLKLKQAAEALVTRTWVSLVPEQASLLDAEAREAINALRLHRPLFAIATPARVFRSLAEIAEAARFVEEAALIGLTVQRGLGVDPARLAADVIAGCSPSLERITFSTIVGTLMANELLDRPPSLVPLTAPDLGPLRARALTDGRLSPTTRAHLERLLDERLAERSFPPPPAFARWKRQWLDAFERTLAPSVIGSPAGDPSFISGLLVRA